ncbi:RNase H family protein [Vibrio parahaemolyticus]
METTVTSNAKEVINAYTDGSCITQKCIGGWAFILTRADKKLERSGHERKTTSNRMELTAAIKALEVIYKKYPNNPITVHTDSQYVKNGITTWIRS